MTGKASNKKGRLGEELAANHLASLGYTIIANNFRGANGEIDLICSKDGTIYFVEVKTRKSKSMVSPAEAITMDKRQRLQNAAWCWLAANGNDNTPCGFLMVFIQLDKNQDKMVIEIVEDYI